MRNKFQKQSWLILFAPLLLSGCMATVAEERPAPAPQTKKIIPAPGSADEYKTAIAYALRYYSNERDPKQYSITAPWRVLDGSLAVCVRLDIPDGRGGWAPTHDFSMFFIENGRIKNMVKDNTPLGCVNREYGPFASVAR